MLTADCKALAHTGFALLIGLTGTWNGAAQNDVFFMLSSLDHSWIQTAFEHQWEHDRYTHTVRAQGRKEQPAVSVAILRYSPDTYSQADSVDLANVGASVIPKDPPYLNERFREDYRYTVLPDTVLLGRPTQIVTVTAVPGRRVRHAIRDVRYYIDLKTGKIVAIRQERHSSSLFYGERGRYWVSLRPGPRGESWVPYQVQVEVRLRLLHQPLIWMRRSMAFYNYGMK